MGSAINRLKILKIMMKLFLLRRNDYGLLKFITHRTRKRAEKYAKILGYNYNSSEWFNSL